MFGKMKAGSLAAVASATFLAASGMLCSMNAAYAQYVGPSQVRQYNNVAEILKILWTIPMSRSRATSPRN